MTDSAWVGGDFQQPVRNDGGVAMCGACRLSGTCRLGLTTEVLGDDDVARFAVVCPPEHEGGPGVAHGGWTAGVMDEVLGHVPLLHGQMSVTGTLTVRFERPVPIGRPLQASAWIERRDPRKLLVAGELVLASSGAVLASANGTFVIRQAGTHFARFEEWLAEQ